MSLRSNENVFYSNRSVERIQVASEPRRPRKVKSKAMHKVATMSFLSAVGLARAQFAIDKVAPIPHFSSSKTWYSRGSKRTRYQGPFSFEVRGLSALRCGRLQIVKLLSALAVSLNSISRSGALGLTRASYVAV